MISEYLKQIDAEPVKLLEATPGFEAGGDAGGFAVSDRRQDGFTARDSDRGLTWECDIRLIGSAAIIMSTLTNKTSQPVPIGDVLVPLRLVFRHPSEWWRHIFANGGTTEFFYPPEAYLTREITDARQAVIIGSHPAGRSSNQHLPLLISCLDTSPESAGLFCGMEWSGPWEIRFDRVSEDQSVLTARIPVNGMQLEAGGSLAVPAVHIGFFTGGPEGGTNTLRRHLYEHVCPDYQGSPTLPRVSYDHWFGIGNNLDESVMKEQANRAAELGVEVFVVDAAWFPGNFPHGVGNWDRIDAEKFPNGLEPVAEHVRELGMDFGLWFEVERAGRDSWLAREHPDWVVPVIENNLHLDLTRQDVQDYVIEMVGGWIDRLDIRWSRWDYNIDPLAYWDAIDPTHKKVFDYMEGLYRVLDTLMAGHPNWMVECCSSGGRRIDLGTLRRAHTCWFSDQTEMAAACRFMQARANRFLPGHMCNSSVAVGREQGDAGFDDAAVLSRMLGKLAFDGDVASWSPAWTSRAAEWVQVFKHLRHLIVQDFYQLLPMPTSVEHGDAVSFVAHDGSEAAVFIFAGSVPLERRIGLKGLRKEVKYRVERTLTGDGWSTLGAELATEGLGVNLAAGEAGLWRLQADRQ